jgi:hypothetical protein
MRRRGAPPPPRATTAPLAAAALLALSLAACAAEEAAGARASAGEGPPPGLLPRATLLGVHTRAALACGVPLSPAAQDRAAAIEAAALRIHQRQGGAAARDAYLVTLAPPAFDARQAGRDRAAWCAARQPDVERVGAWLDSAEGATFAERAAAAAAAAEPAG